MESSEMRRILLVAEPCYFDPWHSAAVSTRAMMELLARQRFSVEALTSSRLDREGASDPIAMLGQRGLTLESLPARQQEPDEQPAVASVPPHTRLTANAVAVTLYGRRTSEPHEPDERERAEFLELVEATLERLRPDVLLSYGDDGLAREVRARAKRRGVAVALFLEHFGYSDPAAFLDVDAVLVPGRSVAEHYQSALGLECTVVAPLIDPVRVQASDCDPRYVTFVDPVIENGVYTLARIADELSRRQPDIPLLVVEGRGTEQTLADCGLDLRAHGTVQLMSHPPDPRLFWKYTRICLVPSLGSETQSLTTVAAMLNGVPVIGSNRGTIPETLGGSGIVLPMPKKLSALSDELPHPDEVTPWVEAVIHLWDDSRWYAEQARRTVCEAGRWSPDVCEPAYIKFFSEVEPAARPPMRTESALAVPALAVPLSLPVSSEPEHRARPSIEAGIRTIERRWPELRNECDDDPVFVLAAGWRSGSTLLQRLLMSSCFLWGEPFGQSALIDSLADHLRCFTKAWPKSSSFYNGASREKLSSLFIANLYPSVEHLVQAHQRFLTSLFAEPARRTGAARWGFKEVRLSADHAIYLKWLFPRAKFLFLVRNPYDAWRSYAARAAKGWKWYNRWPDDPVTVRRFATMWRRLTSGFLEDHPKVEGLVVRYETLALGEYSDIERYLGFPLSQEAGRINPADGPPPLRELLAADRTVLDEELGPLAAALGYTDSNSCQPSDSRTFPPLSSTVDSGPVVEVTPSNLGRTGRNGLSLDPGRCVILVPAGSHIELACDEALRMLERRGYTVRRVHGYSAIDQGRNQIATNALRDGFDELMWIDSDIAFDTDAVERLRAHGLPVCCGVYPKKGPRSFACNFPGELRQAVFGGAGGLVEIPYAGAGFLHTRREVYQVVQKRLGLVPCNERFGPSMIPFFQPLVIPDGSSHWYLPEDYSFCHRVRQCGFRIVADTTIRLRHIGSYTYGWEDTTGERREFASFTFRFEEEPD